MLSLKYRLVGRYRFAFPAIIHCPSFISSIMVNIFVDETVSCFGMGDQFLRHSNLESQLLKIVKFAKIKSTLENNKLKSMDQCEPDDFVPMTAHIDSFMTWMPPSANRFRRVVLKCRGSWRLCCDFKSRREKINLYDESFDRNVNILYTYAIETFSRQRSPRFRRGISWALRRSKVTKPQSLKQIVLSAGRFRYSAKQRHHCN